MISCLPPFFHPLASACTTTGTDFDGSPFGAGGKQTSGRREAKNTKFGFGGRKRLKKQNDSISAADMNDYKASRGKKGGPKKGTQRPGKSKRAAARSKN